MNNDNNNNRPSDENLEEIENSIKEVITRVITDTDFKELLIKDPDTALKGYTLTETQVMLLKSLDAEDFDKLTPENLTELFSADSAVYTPDEGDSYEDYEEIDDDEELK